MLRRECSEDREACFAAGMNDFLSKLVVPKKLFELLLKWLPGIRNGRDA